MLPFWTAASPGVARRAQVTPEPVQAPTVSPRQSEVRQAGTDGPPPLSIGPPSNTRQASVRQRLNEAHQAGRLFKRRVRMPTLALGLSLMLSGVPLALGLSFTSDSLPTDVAVTLAASFLVIPGLLFLLLSLFPTDTRSVYFSGLTAMIVCFTFALLYALKASLEAMLLGFGESCPSRYLGVVPCWFTRFLVASRCVYGAICAGAGVRLLLFWLFGQPQARSRINFLWKSTRQTFAGLLALNVCFLVVAASSGILGRAFTTMSPARGIWVAWIARDAWQAAFVLLLHLPSFRTTVQSYLARRDEVMMAAAGVASLLEGRDVCAVLTMATELFRSITLDKLSLEALLSSEPDANLYALSEPRAFGDVHVFVSHSWSDDPLLKWEALQQWRSEFKARHQGREPRLFLDRACINHARLSDSLACLPSSWRWGARQSRSN
ncbi:hypothetical protein T492DRAFT_1015218 [Pavlovales sp. CCMP2436]|nr:hypothetical protein T492DRAFT_1015218 [Pavlovales sp. CCMP2436]